jgi:hypothetical protein
LRYIGYYTKIENYFEKLLKFMVILFKVTVSHSCEIIQDKRKRIMIEITNILEELSKDRPVFHSEADFQHALAWKIHEKYPDLNVRLERRVTLCRKAMYFDIFTYKDNKIIAVEVKYKTKALNYNVGEEEFTLENQQAQDQGRYDFVKDISRLEKLQEKYRDSTGFAIFLTNDKSYWERPKRNGNAKDKSFRIHEGEILKGTLRWTTGTSEGTIKGREEPIKLRGKYTLNWRDYLDLKTKNGLFKYLLIKVD